MREGGKEIQVRKRRHSSGALRTSSLGTGGMMGGLGVRSVRYMARDSSRREGGTFSFRCRSSHYNTGQRSKGHKNHYGNFTEVMSDTQLSLSLSLFTAVKTSVQMHLWRSESSSPLEQGFSTGGPWPPGGP